MQPGLGPLHPQVVHFAIALLFAGVLFRLISLTGKLAFTGPAATALVVLGTVATLASVKTGEDAHGPVERIPGVRAAVVDHEEWGERARNVFLLVSLVEAAALVLAIRQSRAARGVAIAAGLLGAAGLGVLYQAAAHGGALVYEYGGGPGLRTGNPEDVNRLFISGLYQQALQDRGAGRGDDGADLVDLAARRFPQRIELQVLQVEWMTDVRKDPVGALARLDQVHVPATDTRLRLRAGLARAAALAAQGNRGGARAVLQTLRSEFPTSPQVQRRLEELDKQP